MVTIAFSERTPAARAGVSMTSHDSPRTRAASELESDIAEYCRGNAPQRRFHQQKRQHAGDQGCRYGPCREIPQLSESVPAQAQINLVWHTDPDTQRIRGLGAACRACRSAVSARSFRRTASSTAYSEAAACSARFVRSWLARANSAYPRTLQKAPAFVRTLGE